MRLKEDRFFFREKIQLELRSTLACSYLLQLCLFVKKNGNLFYLNCSKVEFRVVENFKQTLIILSSRSIIVYFKFSKYRLSSFFLL